MIQVNASLVQQDPRGGFVVAVPHDYDAMGSTLRAAFGDDRGLPCDIQRALDAIEDEAPDAG